MEQRKTAEHINWLMDELSRHFGQAVSTMTGAEQSVAWRHAVPTEVPSTELLGQLKRFSLGPEAAVWIGGAETAWRYLGESSLRAAGIKQPAPEDVKNAYFEILNQSISGLARSLSKLCGNVIVAEGREDAAAPGTPGYLLELSAPDAPPDASNVAALLVYPFPELLSALFTYFLPPKQPVADGETEGDSASQSYEASQYELLLDVELPVSVSFGRTQIPLKEVLKLATGSIVELNRTVTDPVEVIVNNCVIARGEVVIVGGNYGVRVRQIISRNERLRTLY
jgi:flagellar motor switch protein FliN